MISPVKKHVACLRTRLRNLEASRARLAAKHTVLDTKQAILDKAVGSYLRRFRLDHRLALGVVAKAVKISDTLLWKIEQGTRSVSMTLEFYNKLEAAIIQASESQKPNQGEKKRSHV